MKIIFDEIVYYKDAASMSSKLFFTTITDFNSVKNDIETKICDIFPVISSCSLKQVKSAINNLLEDKTDKQKHGIVAEFFMHLVLRQSNFQKASCLENLEENSMKKGFDGLFIKNEELFLAESKSGYTPDATHKSKFEEAISQLENTISGKSTSKQNPWKNAYSHFLVSNAQSLSIKDELEKLAKDYIDKKYPSTTDFNVIPSVTLFDNIDQMDLDSLKTVFSNVLTEYSFKSVSVVCIDNSVYNDFLEFLANE